MTFATLLVAVGSKFETRLLPFIDPDFSVYVLLLWGGIRWAIATLTSISVIALIYHHAVPRTQPWHSVMPGAMLATVLWFSTTVGFRAYLQHFGDFATIYGSLGVAMALLVWMYLISLVVLVGAEFNALLFPRAMLGKELTALNGRKACGLMYRCDPMLELQESRRVCATVRRTNREVLEGPGLMSSIWRYEDIISQVWVVSAGAIQVDAGNLCLRYPAQRDSARRTGASIGLISDRSIYGERAALRAAILRTENSRRYTTGISTN